MFGIIILGVFVGSVYGLLGLGLSLIFSGIKRSINLAHGMLTLLGSYLSFTLANILKLDPLSSVPLVAILAFCIGYLFQSRLLNKALFKDPTIYVLSILSIGLVLENLFLVIWGPDLKTLAVYTTYALANIKFFDFNVPLMYLIVFLVTLVLMLLIYTFLKHTYVGITIRATSEDHSLVQNFGVNPMRVFAITFGIGSLLAAISGILIGLIYPFSPSYGFIYLNMAFGVLVLGGMGSIRGPFIAGLILGLVHAFSSYYLGLTYPYLIGCLVILIILAVKPEGLFGYKI